MKRAILGACLLAMCARATAQPAAEGSAASVATEPPASRGPTTDAPSVPAPVSATPTPSSARVQAALARYRREPSIADVVHAARRAMTRSPTDSMASRARAAGWIPTLEVSARRGQAVDLSSSARSLDDQAIRLSSGDDLTLGASLTFALDRLLFRREEIGIVREARAERGGRSDRIREVVRLYFLRRRLQLERDFGAGDPAEQALGIAEAEALLDAFTDGAFGRMLRVSERRR